MASRPSGSSLARLHRWLEWPLAVLALLVIPALIVEDQASNPQLRAAAIAVNWAVWLAFCADFGIQWGMDPQWLRRPRAWFDLSLILLTPPFFVPDALQGARSLRALRALRLIRAIGMLGIGLKAAQRSFGARKFHLVAAFAVATVLLGAAGVFVFEAGENRSIRNFGDALWWAIVTSTTVGYGDVSPVTTEGRLIAVLLMLTGIGVIGVFTATIAGFFFEQESESETAQILARLEAIEKKLDAIAAAKDPLGR